MMLPASPTPKSCQTNASPDQRKQSASLASTPSVNRSDVAHIAQVALTPVFLLSGVSTHAALVCSLVQTKLLDETPSTPTSVIWVPSLRLITVLPPTPVAAWVSAATTSAAP